MTKPKAAPAPPQEPQRLDPVESVQGRILTLRGQRIIVDADLAALYEVPTKALNQAVKRNADRFPEDFAFRLDREEAQELVTICDRFGRLKHSSTLPLAFTEHGAIAAAFVLNSPRAIQISAYVVRAFVQLRRMASEVASLSQRLENLEQETARRFQDHDGKLQAIFQALRELLNRSQEPTAVPAAAKRPIGFRGQKK